MKLRGYFTFDNKTSYSFGAVDVVQGDVDIAPARDMTAQGLPGRNGDVLIDNQRYPNVTMTYWVMIRNDFDNVYQAMRSFLLSRKGYCRLTDSWNTAEYYEAYVAEDIEPIVSRGRGEGAFLLTFIRKPQRFLVSAETPVTLTASTTTVNTGTLFPSRPIISVKITDASVLSVQDLTFFRLELTKRYASFYSVVFFVDVHLKIDSTLDSSNLSAYILQNDTIQFDFGALEVTNYTRRTNLTKFLVSYKGTALFPEVLPDLPAAPVSGGNEYRAGEDSLKISYSADMPSTACELSLYKRSYYV